MSHVRYQIKVTLMDTDPPIWRRMLVPPDCTMDALHAAIQRAMGWMDCHLYAFRTRTRFIDVPEPEGEDMLWGGPQREDAAQVHLKDVAGPGESLFYDYDFGDGWTHLVEIEQAVACDELSARKAECVDGARACPPEDCGGPWGYANLLAILAKRRKERDEREQELAEWIGEDWDAEAFDIADANAALARWRPNTTSMIYDLEHGESP